MRPGEQRNAELGRASIILVAGAALVGLSQGSAGIPAGPIATLALAGGGLVVVVGLVIVIRALFRRSGGADQ